VVNVLLAALFVLLLAVFALAFICFACSTAKYLMGQSLIKCMSPHIKQGLGSLGSDSFLSFPFFDSPFSSLVPLFASFFPFSPPFGLGVNADVANVVTTLPSGVVYSTFHLLASLNASSRFFGECLVPWSLHFLTFILSF